LLRGSHPAADDLSAAMRQLAELPADTRRRAIIAATAVLLLVMWCEVTAIALVSARVPAEQAMFDDERLHTLRYTLGHLDVSIAQEALRSMAALGLPLKGLTLAKPHMHRAAEAAKWNPKHPTAKEWLDNVHDPYHGQSAQFAMMHPYFRAACAHGEASCPAQQLVPLEKLAGLSPEQRDLFRPERSDDAYISFGNSVRPALPEADVGKLLQQVRIGLATRDGIESLDALGVELARARAAEKARGWQHTLSRMHDIIHNTLFEPYCLSDVEQDFPEGTSPQHCRRYHWMTLVFRYDTIGWIIVLIVVMQAYRTLLWCVRKRLLIPHGLH
jgi:hypothetical protein